MGLSLVVGGVAAPVALLALALRTRAPLAAALLAWAAASGLAVAVSASGPLAPLTTGLLMKDRETGRISPVSRVVFLPYHLALRGKLLVQFARGGGGGARHGGWGAAQAAAADGASLAGAGASAAAAATMPAPLREPLFNEIVPGLYVGGWPRRGGQVPAGSSVLDVTCELPRVPQGEGGGGGDGGGGGSSGGSSGDGADAEGRPLRPRQRRGATGSAAAANGGGGGGNGGGGSGPPSPSYLNLPCWDTHTPTPAAIERAVAWALGERRAGHSIYVHCAHGHGRSATVAGAVLIASGAASDAPGAVRLMQAARPRVRLNRRQAAALDGWVALRAGRGVEMGAGGGGTCAAE